ncbi:MAG: Gp138 family membrane-puncturing spike protein [Lachnospiraceae bacterium]
MNSEFTQAMKNMVNSAVNNVHTALPGTIRTYDSAKGLCTVKPAGSIKTTTGTMDYPEITGVPIVSPDALATPIKAGDTVLLIICEGSIAGFLSGKTEVATLHHSLSNAVCIPNLRKVGAKAQQLANDKGCTVIDGNLYVTGSIESVGSIQAPNI